MTLPDKTTTNSLILKLLASYQSAKTNSLLFPVASCSSHIGQNAQLAESNSTQTGNLTVPGIRPRRKPGVDFQKNITELEVKDWLDKETGMDRIRSMYAIGEDGQFVREETRLMNTMWLRTTLVGFCINTLTSTLAARTKKSKHLSMSSAIQKDTSVSQAKTAWREIFRSTSRLSLWAGSLIYISQTIAAYRNETSVLEYVISSAVGFGCIGVSGGIRKAAAFSAIGLVLGFVGGHAICKVMTDQSVTQETRHTRHISQMLQVERLTEGKNSTDMDNGETSHTT